MHKNIIRIGIITLFFLLANVSVSQPPLEIYGLDESEWRELGDGGWGMGDGGGEHTPHITNHNPQTTIHTLALLMDRLRQPLIESIMRDHVMPSTQVDNKALWHQGSVWDFTSRANVSVVSIRQVEYCDKNDPDSKIKVQGIDRFYVCRLRINDRLDAICLTPEIPRDWNITQDALDLSIKSGFFGVLVSSRATPVFVATKMRWYPETLLGKYGMDVASLETVAPIPLDMLASKPVTPQQFEVLKFTHRDRKPFYQLLYTASVIPYEEIEQNLTEESYPVVDLFNRPQSQQGRLVRLTGVARRIEKITVEDEEIIKWFGIDHYYQIALFTADSQGNPLIFCIKNIPEGLPISSENDFQVSLSINGFFYKTWAYKRSSGTQFAPLLIGSQIEWFQVPEFAKRSSVNVLSFTSGVFIILVFLWIAVRCFSRRKKVY